MVGGVVGGVVEVTGGKGEKGVVGGEGLARLASPASLPCLLDRTVLLLFCLVLQDPPLCVCVCVYACVCVSVCVQCVCVCRGKGRIPH